MKIVFVSNYLNHHQNPFCRSLIEQLNKEDSFTFIQTQPMEEERVSMGWGLNIADYDYARCYYDSPDECQQMIDDADVMIFGGVEDEKYVANRLKENRTVIRISERIYKEGQWKCISPRGLMKKYHDHIRYKNRNVYLMCAGGYVASDFNLIGAYPGKMLTWGYWPEFENLDKNLFFDKDEKKIRILWAGRMIDWKHPEHAIAVAEALKAADIKFDMVMAGDGNLFDEIKEMSHEKGLDNIIFPGFMKPQEIRDLMKQSDIFLFTSDFKEGWGVVLNEAMNSGCAVVAGSGIGAVPTLLNHKENGMVYKNGHVDELIKYVLELVEDKNLCRKLGQNAYDSIKNNWTPDIAAKNFIGLINEIKTGTNSIVNEGPASRAEIVSPSRGYKYTRRKKYSS